MKASTVNHERKPETACCRGRVGDPGAGGGRAGAKVPFRYPLAAAIDRPDAQAGGLEAIQQLPAEGAAQQGENKIKIK